MPFPVIPTLELINRLAALNSFEYPLTPNQAIVSLYTNNISPDENSTATSFVTDPSLSTPLVVMGLPAMNDQGMVVAKSNLLNWGTLPGDPVITCYGIFITDHTGDTLIAAQKFDTPQILGGSLPQAITGVWRVSEPQSSIGWLNVEN